MKETGEFETMIVVPAAISLTAVAAGATTVIRGSTHSRATLWGPILWRGPSGPGCSKVALTFDDGPTDGPTQDVLELLAKLNVKATFFVIGKHVQQHPALLRQVQSAGHLIANHTFDHPHHGYLSGSRYWMDQIEKTNRVIEDAVGERPVYFRSPMGVRTWRTTGAVHAAGMSFVTWTRRALDGLPTTADRIVQRMVCGAAAGDILLLHDGIEAGAKRVPQATIDALPRILSALRESGLEPVRLDELCEGRGCRAGNSHGPNKK
jgi:peptidoglycan/xylan/chitin deacetylase (PgdA/CDA1 family)